MRCISLLRRISSLFNLGAIPRAAHRKKSCPGAVRHRQSRAPVLPQLESSILKFNHQVDILLDDTCKVNLTKKPVPFILCVDGKIFVTFATR